LQVSTLLECGAVPTLVNSSGLTALELALANNSDTDILNALRTAEARDMDNVANGIKNKALRKRPVSAAPIDSPFLGAANTKTFLSASQAQGEPVSHADPNSSSHPRHPPSLPWF